MGAAKDLDTKVVREEKDAVTSEKVSVNMNPATLAQIDLLVENGYFSNRSDFINNAVRKALDEKNSTIERIVDQKKKSTNCFFIGITKLNRQDFEQWKAQGDKARINGYGALILPNDCDELIIETVESIHVTGKIYCSERIKKVYLPNL